MEKSFPRVLHIGYQPIGAPTNSGLTLGSMFAEWPTTRLLQVCMRDHPTIATPANAVISPLSIAPIDGLVRRALGDNVPAGATDGLNHAVDRRGMSQPLKERVRNNASVVNDLGPVHIPRVVRDSIEAFRPQAVHSLLGSVRTMRIALAISHTYDLPIAPHFMDDWPATIYSSGQLGGLARREIERTLDAVLRRSPMLFVIGGYMATEYQKRFRRPTTIVGNSVTFRDYSNAPTTAAAIEPVGRRRLAYVGGLHLGRDALMSRVADALCEVDTSWQLSLHVPTGDAAIAERLSARHANVVHAGSLPPDAVPAALSEAGSLLFLESSDPAIAAFTRLSVSTKVPQYLAAGRPILAVGPQLQGSMQALRQSSLTVTVSPDSSAQELTASISRLMAVNTSEALPESVRSVFDSEATRERLRTGIGKVISQWGDS